MKMHRFKKRCVRNFLKKLWILSNIDELFYPVVLYTLYLPFGPWFAGDVIDGRIGIAFAWGTFFAGKFLPGTMSYFYGFTHVMTFNGPLLLVVANTAHYRWVVIPNSCNCY